MQSALRTRPGPGSAQPAKQAQTARAHGARAGMPAWLRSRERRNDVPIQRQEETGGSTFQLTPPSLLQPPAPTSFFGDEFQLKLDPEIQAQVAMILMRGLRPAALYGGLLGLNPGDVEPTTLAQLAPETGPLAPAAPDVGGVTESTTPATEATAPSPAIVPEGTYPAGFGIWYALAMATPQVQAALGELSAHGDRIRNGLGTGGLIGFGIAAAAASATAIVPLSLDPRYRDPALRAGWDLLNGSVLPIPGTPAHVEFNLDGSNLTLGLHLDVGRVLPEFLGFGSRGFLGPGSLLAPLPAQRSAGTETLRVANPDAIANAIRNASAGIPLPEAVRRRVEHATGVDLSDVTIHADHRADALARSLDAKAFASGARLFFRRDAYDPDTEAGRTLIAHEAAHAAQQKRGPVDGMDMGGGLRVNRPGDAFEHHADRIASSSAGVKPAARGFAAHSTVQREAASGECTCDGACTCASNESHGLAGGAVQRMPESNQPPPPPPSAPGGGASAAGPSAAPPAASAPTAQAPGPGGAAAPATPAPAAAAPGAAAGPDPLMPDPPADLSAEERARLEGAGERARDAADANTDLPDADAQVTDAREAVQEPAAETEARAQDALVDELGQRPEPSPEIEELCTRIRRVIRERRPPDEESLVHTDMRGTAQQAGGELNQGIETDTERVQGEYDRLEEQPQGTPEQVAQPMDAPPGRAEAAPIDGARATPDGVSEDDVSLDADVAAAGQQIEDAGMNTEPAQLVESGPIAEARGAQGELAETAARDPQEVLAEQQALLASASADMTALTASALEALQTSRAEATTSGRAQQIGMVGSEEEMRTRAGADAERIFSDAQSRVSALLEPLPRTAMQKWESGVRVLSTEFEQHLAAVKRWIDERHESVVLEVVDYLTGLPGWVTEHYDRAEQTFGDGVCDLIREISTEVNGVVLACEAIIDDARAQIDAVFAALPAELQGWAAEQQAEFGSRLDELEQNARQTRDDFNRDLVERAAQSVQEVREKVHALREAARGLLGRIQDAVEAFLEDPAKFIIEGLLELVGIAPAAFWAVVNRIGQAIESIADDPLNFANNLVSALAQGFQQFFDNVAQHLLQGLMDWLFAGLGAVGVQIPGDLSLRSIITFFLQLMGLSWANIRQILVRHIGEENVALIEKAWELISALIELGPEGIFEMVQEQLDPANLLSIVLDAAVDYLIEALIKAVTPRIIALFNPAGAIIQAIEAIYRVLSWVFNNAARLFSLVETVVNGVMDLIGGNIAGMATAIEGALARLLTPVIDFLAGYLGLGDLPEKIADVIRGLQQRVLAVVERVIAFLAERARALLGALGIGEDADDEVDEDDPEKAEKVRAGLAAIDAEEQRLVEEGRLSREEAAAVAAAVQQAHPVFQSLRVVDGGDSWDYAYTASPEQVKEGETKEEGADPPTNRDEVEGLIGEPTGTPLPEDYGYRVVEDRQFPYRRRSTRMEGDTEIEILQLGLDQNDNIILGPSQPQRAPQSPGARARAEAEEDLRESIESGIYSPQALYFAEQTTPDVLEHYRATGELPTRESSQKEAVEFSHLYSQSEYPELAHRGDLGVLAGFREHRVGHHGGSTRVPLHGSPRDPFWEEQMGEQVADPSTAAGRRYLGMSGDGGSQDIDAQLRRDYPELFES